MVLPLHAALQAEGDEQTDRDGEEMEGEVPEAVHPFVRWVNVDHDLLLDSETG
jgi:hypothetical protein